MAKGNLFQGMARGKVGDVVFSRLNGEQISRVRNRHPKNPNTNSQIYQRAIMASVMLAYSAGKELFDHSFQGYAKGAECQRRFMSVNARKLRGQLASDLQLPSAQIAGMKARVVAPRSITPTPWSFVVSEGSYGQNLFVSSLDDNGDTVFTLPSVTSAETVADYAERQGLIAGDIYTVLVLVPDLNDDVYITEDGEHGYDTVYNTKFGFVRFIVKAGLDSVTDALATYGQLFDIEVSQDVTADFSTLAVATAINISTLRIVVDPDQVALNIGAIGVIRSRRDMDLRSNTTLALNQSVGDSAYFVDATGLVAPYILDAWKQGTTLGDSDLILEGGDF